MFHIFNHTSFFLEFLLEIEWSLVEMLESSQFWFIHKFSTHTNSTYFCHLNTKTNLHRGEEVRRGKEVRVGPFA